MQLKCKNSIMNQSNTLYLYIAGNVYIGALDGFETHVEDEYQNVHNFDDQAVDLYFKQMPEYYNEDTDETGIEVNIIVNVSGFDD